MTSHKISRDPILLSLTFLIGVCCISIPPLWGSSEAREVHVAWSLFHDGSWLLPLRNGIIPSKPPLFHWIAAIVSVAFGDVSPFTVRIVSLAACILTIYRTMQFGRLLISKIHGISIEQFEDKTALQIWIILTTTYGFIISGMDAKVDMLFCLFITLSIIGFLDPLIRDKDAGWFSLYVWASFAVLTKGPLGLVLPIAISFFCYLFLRGSREAMLQFCLPRLGMLCLILPIIWYVASSTVGGDEFLSRQLIFENFKRLSGGEKINSESWWFYIPSFIRGAAPWSIILFYLSYIRITNPIARITYRGNTKLQWLGVIWLVLGLILFSTASGKRHSYLLPLLPGMALTLSIWINKNIHIAYALILSTLICFCYSIGVSVKGGLKGFIIHAKEIKSIVNDDTLVLIKERHDEYFDPILFYLQMPVVIYQSISSCNGYILGREEILNKYSSVFNFEKIREFSEYNRKPEEPILILARCRDHF